LATQYFPKKVPILSPQVSKELVDSPLEEVQLSEVVVAERQLAKSAEAKRDSWTVASRTVRDYKPVSGYLWRIVHAVLGKPDKIGSPDPMLFDALKPLLLFACRDPRLGTRGFSGTTIDSAVNTLNPDVAAAICVIYGVCRRISGTLTERLWRPIIDDALIRASIGYLIGKKCPKFGAGRGLLAGFCGRAGLAVQIASADSTKAQRALEGLAAGRPMKDVGISVYGCDPLQVSAMVLASAGVTAEAAYGIAGFSNNGKNIKVGAPAYFWLSVFSVAEYLRITEPENVSEKYWLDLGFEKEDREQLRRDVSTLLIKGHNWDWLLESQVDLNSAVEKE
jgi:hypothetical protein